MTIDMGDTLVVKLRNRTSVGTDLYTEPSEITVYNCPFIVNIAGVKLSEYSVYVYHARISLWARLASKELRFKYNSDRFVQDKEWEFVWNSVYIPEMYVWNTYTYQSMGNIKMVFENINTLFEKFLNERQPVGCKYKKIVFPCYPTYYGNAFNENEVFS